MLRQPYRETWRYTAKSTNLSTMEQASSAPKNAGKSADAHISNDFGSLDDTGKLEAGPKPDLIGRR